MADWTLTGTAAAAPVTVVTTYYASQTNMENLYGEDNILTWSNIDNTGTTANTTRINAGLAYADKYIDDRFRNSKWHVPFSPAPELVKQWAATLASYWIYKSRGLRDATEMTNKLRDDLDKVDTEIAEYLAGIRDFDYQQISLSESPMPTAPQIVD